MVGDESRDSDSDSDNDSESMTNFIVVQTVIGTGPFLTIRRGLDTLNKSDNSENSRVLSEGYSGLDYRNPFSSFEVSGPSFRLPRNRHLRSGSRADLHAALSDPVKQCKYRHFLATPRLHLL
jgi:hypothetical protein